MITIYLQGMISHDTTISNVNITFFILLLLYAASWSTNYCYELTSIIRAHMVHVSNMYEYDIT